MNATPGPAASRGLPLLGGLLLLAAAAAGVAGVWHNAERLAALDQRLADLAENAERQHQALQLLRFEQRSKQGLGMAALLDQLSFWGAQYDHASTPAAERDAKGVFP